MPDMAHYMKMLTYAEYAYATTNVQLKSRSEEEKVVVIPDTFKEAMGLPEAALWKAALDKEMTSLDQHHVYDLIPRHLSPAGRNQPARGGSTKSSRTRPSWAGLLSKAGDKSQE